MSQPSSFPSTGSANVARWRPQWAFATAIVLLVGCVGTLGFGLLMVIVDLSSRDDFLDGVGALIGGMIGLPGLLAGIPLAVFLARRGGRLPFFLGLVLGLIAGATVWWVFNS